MPSHAEWAWAAGLFEGEGCITLTTQKGRGPGSFWRALALVMTDEDTVRRFHGVVGCGSVHHIESRDPPRLQDQWRWRTVSWPDIVHVLHGFRPWFGDRRRGMCEYMLLNAPARVRGEKRQWCPEGHDLSDGSPHLYESDRNARICNTCRLIRVRIQRLGWDPERARNTPILPVGRPRTVSATAAR